MNLRVFEYDGAFVDRYTIVIGNSMYGMSTNPLHPQGFNQCCGEVEERWMNRYPPRYTHLGKELTAVEILVELPEEVRRAIAQRCDGE